MKAVDIGFLANVTLGEFDTDPSIVIWIAQPTHSNDEGSATSVVTLLAVDIGGCISDLSSVLVLDLIVLVTQDINHTARCGQAAPHNFDCSNITLGSHSTDGSPNAQYFVSRYSAMDELSLVYLIQSKVLGSCQGRTYWRPRTPLNPLAGYVLAGGVERIDPSSSNLKINNTSFNSTVWSAHQEYLIDDMDRIQRRFLHLVGLKLGFGYRHLRSMTLLRMAQDVPVPNYLYRILNVLVDCPEILGSINLRVPSNTRSQDLFGRLHHAANYDMNSTINRMQRLGNLVAGDDDLFHDGIAPFKRTSLAILEQRSCAVISLGFIVLFGLRVHLPEEEDGFSPKW
ncbi:hypothetical protein J6590_051668 [Homalodisca vitripennis]|nr:hypothetical protein J6590_051668 [Homalodisca vitripennis]